MPELTRPTIRLSLLVTPEVDAARDDLSLAERLARLGPAALTTCSRTSRHG
jgi:hypothetical protein